ncbi:MAG: hypothetical protein GY937_14805 [bacterium]|nr:hypothetical protein [bacterium]
MGPPAALSSQAVEYVNASGALPPACVPGSAAGLKRVTLEDHGIAGIRYEVSAQGLSWPGSPNASFFRFAMAFEPQPAPGIASASAQAGLCLEVVAPRTGSNLSCRVVKKKRARPRWKRIRRYDCAGT